jgi:hypothetical protein
LTRVETIGFYSGQKLLTIRIDQFLAFRSQKKQSPFCNTKRKTLWQLSCFQNLAKAWHKTQQLGEFGTDLQWHMILKVMME